MRIHFIYLILLIPSQALAVENPPTKQGVVEVSYTHSELVEKAASDLKVRQLQKLVNDRKLTPKKAQVKSASQKR